MSFIEYYFTSPAICLGERTKGGTFRPCCRTIRYSQITGALRRALGRDDLHAAGHLLDLPGANRPAILTYAPRDRAQDLSRLPLQVEYLVNAEGLVYVMGSGEPLPDSLDFEMGGLLSKGLGRSRLKRQREVEPHPPRPGTLNTRIPLDFQDLFGIAEVIMPRYGYLFRPEGLEGGVYVLSLFEGSHVVAPEWLLAPEEAHGQH